MPRPRVNEVWRHEAQPPQASRPTMPRVAVLRRKRSLQSGDVTWCFGVGDRGPERAIHDTMSLLRCSFTEPVIRCNCEIYSILKVGRADFPDLLSDQPNWRYRPLTDIQS